MVEPPSRVLRDQDLQDCGVALQQAALAGEQETGQVHFGVGEVVSFSAGANVFGAEMGGNVCKRKFI